MNLVEFWDALDAHDWYYVYADDSKAYREGSNKEKLLWEEANKNGPQFLDLFRDFKYFRMTTKPGQDRVIQKPKRPASKGE